MNHGEGAHVVTVVDRDNPSKVTDYSLASLLRYVVPLLTVFLNQIWARIRHVLPPTDLTRQTRLLISLL